MAVDRSNIEVRVFRSFAEHDAADREWWLAIPPAERVLLVWQLSKEQWAMKGRIAEPDDKDFVDFLSELNSHRVRFLIVGAYALGFHGRPRATGDMDVWIEPSAENASRAMAALRSFGAPLGRVTEAELARPGLIFEFGLAPHRIDLLTEVSGLDFAEGWATRARGQVGPCEVHFLGKTAFLKNKRASGRPKDLVDADAIDG